MHWQIRFGDEVEIASPGGVHGVRDVAFFSPQTVGNASSHLLSVTKCKTSSKVASRFSPWPPFSKISSANKFCVRDMIVSSSAKLESRESCSVCDAKSTMVEIVEFEATNEGGQDFRLVDYAIFIIVEIFGQDACGVKNFGIGYARGCQNPKIETSTTILKKSRMRIGDRSARSWRL